MLFLTWPKQQTATSRTTQGTGEEQLKGNIGVEATEFKCIFNRCLNQFTNDQEGGSLENVQGTRIIGRIARSSLQ